MAQVATVTIDNTQVSSDLTNFVVYVRLSDMPAVFWSTVANGGGDIRCYKSDGTTELAREVVSCNTSTETGELHIRYAGTLSSTVDTEIQIYADGVSSDYAVTATYGRNNVWTDYDAVYHMEGDPSTTLTDSTGNGYDMTTTSMTSANEVTGKLGSGVSTSAADYATYTEGSALVPEDDITLQCWMNSPDLTNPVRGLAIGDASSAIEHRVLMLSGNVTSDPARGYIQGTTGTTVDARSSTGYSSDTWHKVDAKFSFSGGTSTCRVGLDGAGFVTDSQTLSAPANYNEIWLGYLGDSTPNYQAVTVKLDEARIAQGTLSDAHITTEYINQNTPTTFYTATAAGTILPLIHHHRLQMRGF